MLFHSLFDGFIFMGKHLYLKVIKVIRRMLWFLPILLLKPNFYSTEQKKKLICSYRLQLFQFYHPSSSQITSVVFYFMNNCLFCLKCVASETGILMRHSVINTFLLYLYQREVERQDCDQLEQNMNDFLIFSISMFEHRHFT